MKSKDKYKKINGVQLQKTEKLGSQLTSQLKSYQSHTETAVASSAPSFG